MGKRHFGMLAFSVSAIFIAEGCFFTEREQPPFRGAKGEPEEPPATPPAPEWPVCVPGERQTCYSGPSNNAGVGICNEGWQYCRPDGDGYWECEGSTLPRTETCGDDLDDDCNGLIDDAPGCLIDHGLVTRHFIDEASSGWGSGQLVDSTPEPLDLNIEPDPDLNFCEDGAGHRGLCWSYHHSGRAWSYAGGTKLAGRLDGKPRATAELVIRADDYGPAYELPIMSLGDMRLEYRYYDGIEFFECSGCGSSATGQTFDLRWERTVIHVVIDYDAQGAEWIRIYENGLLAGMAWDSPYQSSLYVPPNAEYSLGRSGYSPYSFVGGIYYAAIYDAALTDAEISHNAEVLLAMDDLP